MCKSLDGEKTWELVGLISLLDPPRDDSAETIVRAQELGIQACDVLMEARIARFYQRE